VPYFATALAPGQYTLVLMTWEDLSSSDFDAGYAPYDDLDFAAGTKSTTFELWGPVGGITLGHLALAATGVETGYAGVGLLVTVAGFVLLVISRRRKTARA
ncbi:MAG: hypothetical protein ABL886_09725, partial [Rhodoglobus sp.]